MNTKLMSQILAASGRNEKVDLLRTADKATATMLQYALDPYRTYGVTLTYDEAMDKFQTDEMSKLFDEEVASTAAPAGNSARWWADFSKLLDRLRSRVLSGNAARETLRQHFAKAPTVDDATWARRVLHKDLECGVSVKSVLKALPGLVNPFDVALAKPLEWGAAIESSGYVEPKIDGLRMLVVDGVAYTRNGNEMQGVADIVAELGNTLNLREWVVDGEVIGEGTFEQTVGNARRSGNDDRGLVYHVFDLVWAPDWHARSTEAFHVRRQRLEVFLARTTERERVVLVPATFLQRPSTEDLVRFRDEFIAQGYEGAMFKNHESPYQFKRSDAILKIKRFDTTDAKVVGVFEGTGKYEGMLGGLHLELPSGLTTECGSGFTDEQRDRFWRDQSDLLGKTVEVKFQNLTAKGKLRHAVFIKVRIDK